MINSLHLAGIRSSYLVELVRLVGTSLIFFIGVGCAPLQLDESKSLELVIESISKTGNTRTKSALLQGMLKGLEGRRNVPTPKGWPKLKSELAQSDSEIRDLANQLSQIFGDPEALKHSLATVNDKSANSDSRRKALRSLMAMQSEEASSMLESLLDDPDLQLEAIRGCASVENPVAPAILLAKFESFSPEHRKAAIETLASRKRYALELVRALKQKKISRTDIPVHAARSLKEMLGEQFVKVYGEFKSLGKDREKQIAKFKKQLGPKALAQADASRGRTVFNKTCASCHLMYGEGGKVGPDLTGSNRANLDYILLNSVDPSYDVPDGYKMTTVLTTDGRLINGVVAEEDGTKLVLKTAEQPRVVIGKEDIEERKISEKSIMPEGQLDELKPRELKDLIKYLRTTEQVELAK